MRTGTPSASAVAAIQESLTLRLFGPALPKKAGSLTKNEQLAMLDAAIDAAPSAKKEAASDYVFLVLFEQRQGSLLNVLAFSSSPPA